MVDLNELYGVMSAGHSGAWGADPLNPSHVNDGLHGGPAPGADTQSDRASFAKGAGNVASWWQSDLGAPYVVASMQVYWPSTGSDAWQAGGGITIYGSPDGAAWTSIAFTETTGTYETGVGPKTASIYTFAADQTYRYWRIRWDSSGGPFIPYLSMSEWLIIETVAPPVLPGVDIPYEAPEPAGALLEIYATEPGAARWDEALWDEALWSSAAWQDVTPQGVRASIGWGASRAELGILAPTEAGVWVVDLYDPERLLDPANADSPYVGDLGPGLPIRLSHRGVVVRRGVVETIGHGYADDDGLIRATDHVATLARGDVPEDTILPDTLRARARTAIAAAGLAVTVEPDPPAGDPALAPRLVGPMTVWAHVTDAAQQVLHIPYIDRLGVLRFRDYLTPLERGRALTSPELTDLLALASVAGQLSIVEARQTVAAGGALIERRLTPLPSWGARTHTRDDATPDAEGWADAVLADRGLSGLRWVPGEMIPLNADSVEALATLEAVELVALQHLEAIPPIAVNVRIMGGTMTVVGKRDAAATWSFQFEAAQAPATPLYADGDPDPPQFLLDETGDRYLYAG